MRLKQLLTPEQYRRIVACTVKRPARVIRVAPGTYSGRGTEPAWETVQEKPFGPKRWVGIKRDWSYK